MGVCPALFSTVPEAPAPKALGQSCQGVSAPPPPPSSPAPDSGLPATADSGVPQKL